MAAAGIEFPGALRRHFEDTPSTTLADYEGEGYSIRFFLGDGPAVERLDAEVRGGDPLFELSRLLWDNDWVILGADESIDPS